MGHGARGFLLGAALAASLVLTATPPGASAAGTNPGQVYAFGSNFFGELGNTTNNLTGNQNPTPTRVNLPGAQGKLLAVGSEFSLAVTSTNQLFAWGLNSNGQIGTAINAQTINPNPTPMRVSLPEASGPPSFVGAGENYSLALTTTGQLYSFGDNDFGENGQMGDTSSHPIPTLVTLPGANGRIVQVAAGTNSSIALTATGQVFGWGDNFDGALGFPTGNMTMDVANSPGQLSFPGEIGPVTDIAEGFDYGLAITASGQIFTWGDNERGQLGFPADTNPPPNPHPTPFATQLPPGSGQPVEAVAGDSFSLVVTSTGQLFSFGDNDEGELGFSGNNPDPSPTRVSLPGEIGGVVSAAAGFNRSLAVTSSGQLFAWGDNFYGELGLDTGTKPQPKPTLVPFPPGTTVDAVAAGPWATHTLVLIADLSIANSTLPSGQVGSSYNASASANGGTPAYTWRASGLPPGLSLNSSSGRISGTPSAAGTYHAEFTVTDADGISISRSLMMAIAPPPPQAARVTGISVLGPVAKFTIACHGIASQSCAGTLTATTRLRQRGRTIVGVAARVKRRRHRHHRPRPVTVTATVAHGSYSVPARTSATVPLTLNGVGRRVLAQFLRVPTIVKFKGSLTAALHVKFGYPRVAVNIPDQFNWHCNPSQGCWTNVLNLGVTNLPAGATVTLRCRGGGCPIRTRVFKPHRRRLALTRLFARTMLRSEARVTIQVTAARRVGFVVVFTVRRMADPSIKALCLEPGARKPQLCT
jgi:alpha-tubulin suppressor-like RCC1 family protein